MRVRVCDRAYTPVNDATVWLKLTDPAGAIHDVQLERTIDDDGVYTGSFDVGSDGIHQIEVTATSPSGDVQEASTRFLVKEPGVEFIKAGMDTALLKAMADVSGGKFYTQHHADRLQKDLKRLQRLVPLEVKKDIWGMPLVLFLLFGLLTLEWSIRRRRGMS